MTRKPTEIRQAEIKKSVLEIIKNEGIKALSTKNLAKQTGISEGAIFRHFKSKRDIIFSIINDVSVDMIGELQKIAYDETVKPEDRFYNYLCKTITYLTENNGITILLFSEASHANDQEMMEKLNSVFDSQRKLAGKIIADGMNQGIWNSDISIEDVTMLYMGIPITHNINLILTKGKAYQQNFCKNMIILFERILKK